MHNPVVPDNTIPNRCANANNGYDSVTGNAEVHVWKMRSAVIWSIILQFLLLFVFIFSVNFNIFHPLSWLTDCVYIFLSLHVWLKLLVFLIIIFIQGEVCKKDYVTGPLYYSSRFEKVKHMFSMRNVLLLLLHMVIGFTVFWIYSSMSVYSSLMEQCEIISTTQSSEYCLIEEKLFMLLGGLWLGVYYFAKDYIFGSRN